MKTFNTLQELYDYIPRCPICGKQNNYVLRGIISQFGDKRPEYFSRDLDPLKLSCNSSVKSADVNFGLINNSSGNTIFTSKYFDFRVVNKTNEILNKIQAFNNLLINPLQIDISCTSCQFIISAFYRGFSTKKIKFLPVFLVVGERLDINLNKRFRITVENSSITDNIVKNKSLIIIRELTSYNFKDKYYVPRINFCDLNIDKLKNKILTILTFQ